MRRILINRARRHKAREKAGFVERADDVLETHLVVQAPAEEFLAVHEALDRLAAEDPPAANLVKLRYFVGMTLPQIAEALGIPLRSVERIWTYARA